MIAGPSACEWSKFAQQINQGTLSVVSVNWQASRDEAAYGPSYKKSDCSVHVSISIIISLLVLHLEAVIA